MIVSQKTMETKTFKSKVIGIQFDKSVFDQVKADQYLQDNKIRSGKPKPTYDGKYWGAKLGKGKLADSENHLVVPSKEQGVSYLITVDSRVKTRDV